jgi:hypothetical protein
MKSIWSKTGVEYMKPSSKLKLKDYIIFITQKGDKRK